MKRIVIVGASSAIAQHCARLWAGRGAVSLVLVGRDIARTERVAADLRVRAPAAQIEALTCDHADAGAITALVGRIASGGVIDIALIAHGTLPDQQQCQTDLMACQNAISVNGVSPVLFAEAFAAHMQRENKGNLAIIGSVAGDRGRKSNYAYGAAKGLVSRYAQGLQHRFAGTAVRVTLIKPGPTDTPMTAHLKQSGAKLANVEQVALTIVNAIEAGKATVYAPAKWALIMLIIRHLPSWVFNKLNI
jgi:decaprenylphospho-beta-D-erythro-pentofuranosid-2-ulose 2-reductase